MPPVTAATAANRAALQAGWKDVVWPKEHGSWSLALEPVALGLAAAPTGAGGALAVAAVAGFFARRPLRTVLTDPKPDRRHAARRALLTLGAVVTAALFAAIAAGGGAWLPWLLPAAVAGAVFLYFDLQKAGREQQAEVAGAFAFAWIPAAFAILGGWTGLEASALGVVMIARAVPTVLTVRSCLRARKTGVRAPGLPLAAAIVAAIVTAALAWRGVAPVTAAIAVFLLAARSFVLLVSPRPNLRASVMGMMEAGVGIVFVIAIAVAWRL